MAKKGTKFISERPMVGGVADHAPAVIRVRLYQVRGGEPRYYLDGAFVHVPVPAWMRRFDGVTVVRVILLALLALAGAGWVLARVVLGGKSDEHLLS